ncbi:hypothetical protein MMC22_002558 [Lobaria immixta]|nr:hypothetical protein [Lobaria immixta]
MNSSENPHEALQDSSAPFYSLGPFSDRKHPRSDSGLSDDDSRNAIGSVQPNNSRRNPLLDSLKHTFPDEPQKLALFELKDLPDHVIVTWLAMARSGSVGPANDLSATAEPSDSLYKDSPYSTSSLGGGIQSRSRSRLIDGPSMYSSDPGTIASEDSLFQPYQTQTLTFPFSAVSSSYEADMSHTIAGRPNQSAIHFLPDPKSQSARALDPIYNPSVTLTDGRRSSSTSIIAPQVRGTSRKDLSARRFASREKFIKHLRSHELPSDCRQLEEWKRQLPEKVWGCGFCVKVFDDVEERLFHISRHFEKGMSRADWDPSRVVLSLLTLPYIANEWILRLNVELGVEYYGQAWPEISWSKEDAMALQRRVTSSQENGADLAESAFNTSIVGREFLRRKQQLGFTSLDQDSSVVFQHLPSLALTQSKSGNF